MAKEQAQSEVQPAVTPAVTPEVTAPALPDQKEVGQGGVAPGTEYTLGDGTVVKHY